MKSLKIQNTVSACAGRVMLYCYRGYILLFKETRNFKPVETKPAKSSFVRFTSNQFVTPCYN